MGRFSLLRVSVRIEAMELKSWVGDDIWYSWRVLEGAWGEGMPGVGLKHDYYFNAKLNFPKFIVFLFGNSLAIFPYGVKTPLPNGFLC